LERYASAAGPRRAGKLGTNRHKAEPAVASLLACRLETGRTHQIRVHLASIGHPVMGDQTYGSGFRTKSALLSPRARAALADLGRQALHAHILTVKHPSSGEIVTFRSELPPDLARLHSELVRGRAESEKTSPDNG
jgi:23S rRNA pseudouridine1911/1915/1917 synthase